MVEVFSPGGRQIAPTLAEEVLPELPKIPPLIRRRGPRVLTPDTVEEFCRLLSVGLSRRQAAARLDIDASTVSKAAKEDRELAALIQRAEDIAAGDPFLCLIAASRKSWRAALSLIQYRRQFREPPLAVDKEERLREQVEDRRLELEYNCSLCVSWHSRGKTFRTQIWSTSASSHRFASCRSPRPRSRHEESVARSSRLGGLGRCGN